MNENRLNFREIQDAHLDQMIRLAFQQEAALRTQELIWESEKPLTPEQRARAEQLQKRMLAQINQEERITRRRNRSTRLRRIVSRFIEAAACVVLVLGIAAPFAIANVESIRSAVMKMLIRIDWEKGEMQMNFVEDNDAFFDVPVDWQGEYFPSYLPEGFEVTWRSSSSANLCIEYTSESGVQVVSFGEASSNTAGVYGIEGATISTIDINGHTAVVIETEYPQNEADHYISITWDNGEKWFSVDASGISKTEVVKIARSVKKIIKK